MGTVAYRLLVLKRVLMQFPIFAFCEGDMEIFSSLDEAVSYIEPIDVDQQRWIVFDAKAVPLRVGTTRVPFGRGLLGSLERAIIEEIDGAVPSPETLRQLICRNLESIPTRELLGVSDAWLTSAPLDEVVLKATSIYKDR